jgi:hypothetical protein
MCDMAVARRKSRFTLHLFLSSNNACIEFGSAKNKTQKKLKLIKIPQTIIYPNIYKIHTETEREACVAERNRAERQSRERQRDRETERQRQREARE